MSDETVRRLGLLVEEEPVGASFAIESLGPRAIDVLPDLVAALEILEAKYEELARE